MIFLGSVPETFPWKGLPLDGAAWTPCRLGVAPIPCQEGGIMAKTKWTDKDGTPLFVKIEKVVLESHNLTAIEKAFYMQLKSFYIKGNKTFPGMSRIIEHLGIHSDTAYKCRKKLQELGIIRYTSERGRKHSCQYTFIFETGTSEEKTMAYKNLMADKIAEINGYLKADKIAEINGNQIAEQTGNQIAEINGYPLLYKEKKRKRRKEQHTMPCVSPFSCQGKNIPQDILHSFESLPQEQQEQIRTYKALYPGKETLEQLAEHALTGKIEIPEEVLNLAEFIGEKLKSPKVENPGAYRVGMVRRYKAGEIDLSEELKARDAYLDEWTMGPYEPLEKVKLDMKTPDETKLHRKDGAIYSLTEVLETFKDSQTEGSLADFIENWFKYAKFGGQVYNIRNLEIPEVADA